MEITTLDPICAFYLVALEADWRLHVLEWWAGAQPWERNGSPIVPEIRSIQASVQSDAATATLGWGGIFSVAGPIHRHLP